MFKTISLRSLPGWARPSRAQRAWQSQFLKCNEIVPVILISHNDMKQAHQRMKPATCNVHPLIHHSISRSYIPQSEIRNVFILISVFW